jgi:uncharacterized protein YdeI (YjbR/CyaY-like superfamily)
MTRWELIGKTMIPTDGFLKVEVRSATDLHAWLLAHHAQVESVWLVTWKKKPGAPFVSMDEVLDELIAFGWTDGLRRKLDDDRTMQLIAPRKQQAWAKTYKDRAERLEAEGRMQPSGRAAIDAAKSAGRWDETLAVDALAVPDDLTSGLRAKPKAAAFFEASAPSYRRNVLRWLHSAKRAETRSARIAKIVEACAEAKKIPQL